MVLLIMVLLIVMFLNMVLLIVVFLNMVLLIVMLLFVARSLALPLSTHFLIVTQAFILSLFPCQTFAFKPQAFVLRRSAFAFQHPFPLRVVVIPLALPVGSIVVVIAILKARGSGNICNAGNDICGMSRSRRISRQHKAQRYSSKKK